jgi:hypothetical protein
MNIAKTGIAGKEFKTANTKSTAWLGSDMDTVHSLAQPLKGRSSQPWRKAWQVVTPQTLPKIHPCLDNLPQSLR